MKIKHLILLLTFLIPILCTAQKTTKYYKYWVTFTDKSNNPFSIQAPEQYLSPKALARRAKHQIGIDSMDLPVNPRYVDSLRNSGANVFYTSKWFNGATVVADSQTVANMQGLKCVDEVKPIGKYMRSILKLRKKNKSRDEWLDYPKTDQHYGKGQTQIDLMNAAIIHQLGYRGKGISIGVLDGGFTNVDISPFFDSLYAENRMLEGYDFADNDDYIYQASSHGTQVLSSMAANLPGLLVGTAPDANYALIITEDVRAEYRMEEYNWIAGLEYADSIGLDMINSSLGYTHFWDANQNYTFDDLDGETSDASKAADIAYQKGILVVNSAGNSGNDAWRHVGVPADARNVLSVGATDGAGHKAAFSSIGPSADGRVKPEISAMGSFVASSSLYSYETIVTHGTSLASPIACGGIASLWSAFPETTNEEMYNAILQSSHQYDGPDNQLGYGIPDFYKAWHILNHSKVIGPEDDRTTYLFPTKDGLKINLYSKAKVTVVDLMNYTMHQENVERTREFVNMDLAGAVGRVLFVRVEFAGEVLGFVLVNR